MSYLLDTHIWIWSLLEPAKLGSRVKRILRETENELWLSPISTWEFLLLVEKGRLRLDTDADSWLADAMERAPLKEAPLTHEIARDSRRVELKHADPADRFLLATARVLGLKMITADERLLEVRGLPVLANR